MVSWGIVSLLFTFVNRRRPLHAAGPARHRRGRLLPRRDPVPEPVGARPLPQQDPGAVLPGPAADHRDRCPAGRLADRQHGVFGLEGWRFMFLCVSIPAILVGIIAWFYLADSPRKAKWLTPDEQDVADREIEGEAQGHGEAGHEKRGSLMAALRSGRVWVLAVHLLRLHLRPVRARVLPAHHHRRVPGAVRHQVRRLREGPHHRDPVPAGRHRAVPLVAGRHASAACKTWHIAVPAFIGGVSVPLALFMARPGARPSR